MTTKEDLKQVLIHPKILNQTDHFVQPMYHPGLYQDK